MQSELAGRGRGLSQPPQLPPGDLEHDAGQGLGGVTRYKLSGLAGAFQHIVQRGGRGEPAEMPQQALQTGASPLQEDRADVPAREGSRGDPEPGVGLTRQLSAVELQYPGQIEVLLDQHAHDRSSHRPRRSRVGRLTGRARGSQPHLPGLLREGAGPFDVDPPGDSGGRHRPAVEEHSFGPQAVDNANGQVPFGRAQAIEQFRQRAVPLAVAQDAGDRGGRVSRLDGEPEVFAGDQVDDPLGGDHRAAGEQPGKGGQGDGGSRWGGRRHAG